MFDWTVIGWSPMGYLLGLAFHKKGRLASCDGGVFPGRYLRAAEKGLGSNLSGVDKIVLYIIPIIGH